MSKKIFKRAYSQSDIDKAFDMGYTTAVIQIEECLSMFYKIQTSMLQSLKKMLPEEEVSLLRTKHNQNKIVNFQSYIKK